MKRKNSTPPNHRALQTALRRELAGLSGGGRRREILAVQPQPDELDQIQSEADREVAIEQIDLETRNILAIRTALDKIDHGTYGICEECEDPIPEKRLKAVPWASYCLKCQAKHESLYRENLQQPPSNEVAA